MSKITARFSFRSGLLAFAIVLLAIVILPINWKVLLSSSTKTSNIVETEWYLPGDFYPLSYRKIVFIDNDSFSFSYRFVDEFDGWGNTQGGQWTLLENGDIQLIWCSKSVLNPEGIESCNDYAIQYATAQMTGIFKNNLKVEGNLSSLSENYIVGNNNVFYSEKRMIWDLLYHMMIMIIRYLQYLYFLPIFLIALSFLIWRIYGKRQMDKLHQLPRDRIISVSLSFSKRGNINKITFEFETVPVIIVAAETEEQWDGSLIFFWGYSSVCLFTSEEDVQRIDWVGIEYEVRVFKKARWKFNPTGFFSQWQKLITKIGQLGRRRG